MNVKIQRDELDEEDEDIQVKSSDCCLFPPWRIKPFPNKDPLLCRYSEDYCSCAPTRSNAFLGDLNAFLKVKLC